MQLEQLKQKCIQQMRDFYSEWRAIPIHHLEQKWITISLLVIGLFVSIIIFDAPFDGINPPS